MEAIVDSTPSRERAIAPHSDAPLPTSTRRRWVGRALSGLAVAFLLFDSAMKLVMVQPVIDATQRMGFPVDTARPIGLVLLACLAIHLVPRTAVLGAVLLTGYLGGAIASHVRLEDPLLSHTLFPIYFGVLVWGGLYLRDPRVRTMAR
ncbi:MAG: DoxX family protein [Polyangiaceae bacterium]